MKKLMTKKFIAVAIFILSFILVVPVIRVQAGVWDDATDFYNSYGSGNLVYRSANATFYYATYGQLAGSTAGTRYRTLGFTVSTTADNRSYSRKMPIGGSIVRQISSEDVNGYNYSLYAISYRDIVNSFNANMGGELKTGNKDITVTFDAVMTLVINGTVQGGLYDNGTTWGTVYTTLAGIRAAAPWPTATYNAFASYFGISKTITKAQIKALDTVKPSVSYSPSSRSWGSGGLSVTVTVSDDFSGISSWKTRVSSDGGSTWSDYTARSGTSATVSLSGTGTWKIQTYVVDNAGNTNTINSGNYYIDGVAPNLSLSASTTDWTKGNVSITVTASDGHSGLKNVAKPDGTTTTSGSFTYSVSSNGTYSFTATDNVGRTTTKSITVSNIDKTAPSLSLAQSPGGLLYYNHESKTGANEFLRYDDIAPLINSNGLIPYVISFDIKTDVAGSVQVYQQNGSTSKYSFSSRVETTTSFTRRSVVVTPQVRDSSQTESWLAFYGTYGTGAIPTVRDVQIHKLSNYWTKGDVTVTATASDSGSGVSTITKPDGTTYIGTKTTYTVSSNGGQTFTVTDKAGNTVSRKITVSNIDKTAPTITLEANTTNWTNDGVTITATISDSASGLKEVTRPDGSTTTSGTITYKVSSNGTYKFTAVDNVGNTSSKSITISNIDKTDPTGSFNPNSKSWTNEIVDVTMTAGDTGSGLKERKYRYSSDNGDTWSGYSVAPDPASGVLSLSAEGIRKIEMVVTDKAGNSKTFKSGVYYIDKTKPSLSLSRSTSSWTKGPVTITATGSDALSGVKRIKLPNGTWVTTTGSTTFEATSNNTFSFVVEDNAGNTYTNSISISNIDNTAPNLTLTPSTTAWTKGNVVITASSTDTGGSGVLNITKPDGTVVTGSSTTFTATANGTYTFKSKDALGNESSKSIVISNIDKTDPTGSFSPNSSSWTKETVSVTMTAGDSGSGVKERKHRYSFDNGATWSDYVIGSNPLSGVLDLSTEGLRKIEMVVTDNAGNTKTFYSGVYQIDKSNPGLTLTQSPTAQTNGNVTITATGSDSLSGVKRIQKPDGTWVNTSSATYQVSSNGSYTFTVEDNVGNITTKSITVSNIDKTAPTLTLTANPTTWTNGSVGITVVSSDSASGIRNVKNPDNTFNTATSYVYTVSANGTYSFLVTDGAGNTTTKSITISNIDKTAPSLNLSLDKTSWTNGNVVISVSSSDADSGVKEITKPDGTKVSTASFSYTVSVNNTYNFQVADNAGNVTTRSITVGNIDKTLPVLTLTQNPTAYTSGKVTITASGTDANSGVKRIQKPDGTWVNGSTATFETTQNGNFSFILEDNAGNRATKDIRITNIDKVGPEAVITPSTTAWTTGNITLVVNATDNLSGVATIKKPDGTVINGESTTFIATENGTYSFEITDRVGNVTTKSIIISNIDRTPPVLNLSIPSRYTNGVITITASAVDSQSGVSRIKLPSGSWVNGASATYTVSRNGVYYFSAEDRLGHTITNYILVDKIDTGAPVVRIINNTQWTNQNPQIVIEAEDN